MHSGYLLCGPHLKERRDWNGSRVLALTLVCSKDDILPPLPFGSEELQFVRWLTESGFHTLLDPLD